jgi:hypothetical protein
VGRFGWFRHVPVGSTLLSAAEPMKRLTIDIPLVMHTTVAAVVLLAFWFWP